jgi:hypothetical protein
MSEVSADQLRRAVQAQHGGKATWGQTEHVTERFAEKTVWNGDVYVF